MLVEEVQRQLQRAVCFRLAVGPAAKAREGVIVKFVKVLPTEYRKVIERQHLNPESAKLAAV